MTAVYKKNNHFHILTGEIWDLESLHDAIRDVIAPYSIETGKCNIVLDLTQLSDRHLYNKPFALSIKRFIDNIYGVDSFKMVVSSDKDRQHMEKLMNTIDKETRISIKNTYQDAKMSLLRGE